MTKRLCEIPEGTRVLATGATGFTGMLLTKKLVAAELKVSALARKTSDITPLQDITHYLVQRRGFSRKNTFGSITEPEICLSCRSCLRRSKMH